MLGIGKLALALAASSIGAALLLAAPVTAAPATVGHPAAARHLALQTSDIGQYLVNYHSGLCAQILNAATTSGAAAAQQTCAFDGGNHSQVWNTEWLPDDSGFLLINYHSGLCLEPQGASTAAGATLVQIACDHNGGNHAEAWTFPAVSDGTGSLIVNHHSSLCARVVGASTSPGALLSQVGCSYTGGDHSMVWSN